MPIPHFKFKHFTIWQRQAAFKVGTDSIMLGSWASIDKAQSILDIGTGTGILAIMCAQRNNEAAIYALDSDLPSILEAEHNVEKCPWPYSVELWHIRLQECTPKVKLDFIITNPPYFVNSLKSGNRRKDQARHTDDLSFGELASFAAKHLTETGKLALILPTTEAEEFSMIAQNAGLYFNRRMEVRTTKEKAPSRHLMEFGVTMEPFEHSTLVIAGERNNRYSDDYIALTKDFYLDH